MIKILHFRSIVKLLLALLLISTLFDLFAPYHGNLKEFDARSVAKLETEMWRSYYDRKPFMLFLQLSQLLRSQYHLPFLKSQYASYEATRAAFIFKKGHVRKDYEKAVPYLVKYYRAIRNSGDIPFNVENAARLELEWWIVHREHKLRPPVDLDNALVDVQSEIYRLPKEYFIEHAHLRAEAMLLRDNLAEKGGVSDENWDRINQLLNASWQSLWNALHKTKVKT